MAFVYLPRINPSDYGWVAAPPGAPGHLSGKNGNLTARAKTDEVKTLKSLGHPPVERDNASI